MSSGTSRTHEPAPASRPRATPTQGRYRVANLQGFLLAIVAGTAFNESRQRLDLKPKVPCSLALAVVTRTSIESPRQGCITLPARTQRHVNTLGAAPSMPARYTHDSFHARAGVAGPEHPTPHPAREALTGATVNLTPIATVRSLI